MQAYALSGISPASTSLRSWNAAGLKALHEVVLAMQCIALLNQFFLIKRRIFIMVPSHFNRNLEFDDLNHEALMGICWIGVLLKKQARRFFRDTLALKHSSTSCCF